MEDQVLGVSQKMTSDNIQRVYRNKLRDAKIAGDEALVNAIEEAHSAIMMRELTQRMQVLFLHSHHTEPSFSGKRCFRRRCLRR